MLNIPLGLHHAIFWADVDGIRYVYALPNIPKGSVRSAFCLKGLSDHRAVGKRLWGTSLLIPPVRFLSCMDRIGRED